jgi:hypothetical protein
MALISADTSAEIKNITLDGFVRTATSPSRHLVSRHFGAGQHERKKSKLI